MKVNQTGAGPHRDSRREARAGRAEAERLALEQELLQASLEEGECPHGGDQYSLLCAGCRADFECVRLAVEGSPGASP